jgi:hypothetical protein
MSILTIDSYVKDDTCKKMCELFDESQELANEREFARGENIHSVFINMQKILTKSKNASTWKSYTQGFAAQIKKIYLRWCEENGIEPIPEYSIEVPRIYRLDPDFGKHNSGLDNDKRIFGVNFYLNNIKPTNFIKLDGKKVDVKKGSVVGFPAIMKFEESVPKTKMKYIIKGYITKKD